MATILISGATGLVGSLLCKHLTDSGHIVHALSRNTRPSGNSRLRYFGWNVKKDFIDNAAFEGVTHVVHLAGAGIADKRWTASRKKEIIDSRVKSALMIKRGLAASRQMIEAFVTASGSNYYGCVTGTRSFTEDDDAGLDFLGDCCLQWEHAAFEGNAAKRVVALRTGVVLSNNGGALPKLLKPIMLNAGAALGSGRQYMPWIHEDDLVAMYACALFNAEFSGSYNAVATEQVTNKEFTELAAQLLGKKIWLPNVPSFALYIMLGEMSEILLEGSPLSNNKLLKTGFELKYPELKPALEQLLNTRG